MGVDPSSRLRLVTLGSPRLEISGAHGALSVAIGPGKPLALITYLAFAPRQLASRDRLCDLLWGDRDIESARAQLRQALWSIRRQVDHGLLETTAEGVALTGNLDIDARAVGEAVEAGALERAVELYTGDFFADYASPGAGRFEEWASLEATRLRTLVCHAIESLCRRALNSGRFGDAVRLAR